MNKEQFQQLIYNQIADHPGWLGAAITALTAGMEAAMDRTNKRAGDCYAGMLAALSLVDANRKTPELQRDMRLVIARAIDAENGCPLEKKFAQKVTP